MAEHDTLNVSTPATADYELGFRDALRLAAEYAGRVAESHEWEAKGWTRRRVVFRSTMATEELAALKGQHWRILEETIRKIPLPKREPTA